MKNNKKEINKKEMSINENLSTITNDIYAILGYEQSINIKKENKIKLTKKEKLFDEYMIKPSITYKILLKNMKRIEENKKRKKNGRIKKNRK